MFGDVNDRDVNDGNVNDGNVNGEDVNGADVNGEDVNGGDGYAALPLPVRKASGFPSSQQLIWRLGRPRQSLS